MGRKSTSGTLSFGIMGIGVGFYKAATERKVKFNTLTKDGEPVKRQWVGGASGAVAEDKTTKKGFLIKKGDKNGVGAEYAVFTQEEVKALEEASDKAVKIRKFVPLESVDPSYFAETFYLAPDAGYEPQYALFATSLQQSGYAAVASWVDRGKEHAVLVRADDDEGRPGLILHKMWNKNEINEFSKNWVRVVPDQDEVEMVTQIIERRAVDELDTDELRDRYAEKVMAEVEKKKKDPKYKVAVTAVGAAAAPAQDNKAMLKQMLADAAKGDAKKAAAKPAKKDPAKKKAAKRRKAG